MTCVFSTQFGILGPLLVQYHCLWVLLAHVAISVMFELLLVLHYVLFSVFVLANKVDFIFSDLTCRYSISCASAPGWATSFFRWQMSTTRESSSSREVFRRQRLNWRSDDTRSQTPLQQLLLPEKNRIMARSRFSRCEKWKLYILKHCCVNISAILWALHIGVFRISSPIPALLLPSLPLPFATRLRITLSLKSI